VLEVMETSVLTTKLSPELLADPRGRKAAGQDWVQTAHEVSFISSSEGAVGAESWHAIPYDRYQALVEGV